MLHSYFLCSQATLSMKHDPVVVHRQYTAGFQIAGSYLERCVSFGTNLEVYLFKEKDQ